MHIKKKNMRFEIPYYTVIPTFTDQIPPLAE